MSLVAELRAIVDVLEDAEIPYALCGGLAVAVHGAPRATRDVDLLVRDEDVERLGSTARAGGSGEERAGGEGRAEDDSGGDPA